MAESGGQPGNQNAAKGREWRNAINRALETRGNGDRTAALDKLAEKLLAVADTGDVSGLRELGDRLDGKSAQSVTVSGDPDNPLAISDVTRKII